MLTNRRIALLVILFIGLLAWRSPTLLTEPRFWGEEGRYYYDALQTSRWSAFTLVVRGNFQLITNFGVVLATFAPAIFAPAVTTYFGCAVGALCVYLFGWFAKENGWTFLSASLVTAFFALFSQGYEVYLSTVNTQWLCAITLLFLAVLPLNDLSATQKSALSIWVGVCALSGVPPVVLAPFFFLAARLWRSRVHFLCGAILAAGAVIQIAIIYAHPHPGREFHPGFVLLTAPWLLQTVASPLITAGLTDSLVTHLRSSGSVAAWVLIYVALAAVACGSVIAACRTAPRRAVPILLTAIWIVVPSIQLFGALGDPAYFVSGWIGGRYFFIGVFCFVLLLGVSANSSSSALRRTTTAVLVWMVATGVYQASREDWQTFILTGPSWRGSIEKCGVIRPCDVQAWPGGPDWSFQLYRP